MMDWKLENTNGKQWRFMTRPDGSGVLYYVKDGDPAHYVFFDSSNDTLPRLQRAAVVMKGSDITAAIRDLLTAVDVTPGPHYNVRVRDLVGAAKALLALGGMVARGIDNGGDCVYNER
jgi:hypothetical protein